MKKITSVFMASVMALSLAACGQPSGSGGAASGGDASQPVLTGEVSGEITVSCYDTMTYKAFLDDAARRFEEAYPGTKVNVETFSAMPEVKTMDQGDKKMVAIEMKDDPQGRADYISKVNTSLMQGGGADVLAMDVLPLHKYASSGQLENLADYMAADPDFNAADYRANILSALTYQGGTWFLPLDYSFNYYTYDSTLLDETAAAELGIDKALTAEQLIELAKPSFDGSSKLMNEVSYVRGVDGGLFGRLMTENYGSLVNVENKSANFDDGAFERILNAVKEYTDLGYISQAVMERMEGGAIMRSADQLPEERYFFKPKNNFSLISHFNRGTGMQMNIMSGSVAGIAIEEDDEIAGIQADANGNVPFTFGQAYAINGNSANKETAWAFIKFLLGKESQLSTSLSPTGLPLNNEARAEKAELTLTTAFGARPEMAGDGTVPEAQPLTEAQREALIKYNEAMERLSDQINHYTMEDSSINDMIATETQYFFEGSKTAAEVASTLQSKVDLYLSE